MPGDSTSGTTRVLTKISWGWRHRYATVARFFPFDNGLRKGCHCPQQISMKKYNVGIIGYGWVATAHIAAINATQQAQVTAIYSSRASVSRTRAIRKDGPSRAAKLPN